MNDAVKILFATMLDLAPDEISAETTPDDVENWDSMQHMILVSSFEEEFSIDIEPEEAVEMYSNYATFERIVKNKLP